MNGNMVLHVVSLKVDGIGLFQFLGQLPNLAYLSVGMQQSQFETLDKDPLLDSYSDLDLVQMPVMGGLLQLRGLRKLEVLDGDALSGKQTGPKWQGLLKQIEELLRAATTQPKAYRASMRSILSVHDILSRNVSGKLQSDATPKSSSANTSSDVLTKEELPRDAAEFARIFFSRPHALFNWFQNAREHLAYCARELITETPI